MKHIKVMLWFDVEDFITPEADDALHALIDMMDSLGIIGSFKMVAEKARVLKARGRDDILRKLSGHEICYHTENHSVHPTQTEYMQHMGFREGAAAFEEREKKGFLDVQEITGQFPTSYGQPGGSWVPQAFPVLKKWGVPTYLDSHGIIRKDKEPYWYGGILNMAHLSYTMRVEFSENGIQDAIAEFDGICAEAGDTKLISIYYHPCEFACREFWDGVNFRRGNNPARDNWVPAPLYSREEMLRRVDVLKAFLQYTCTKNAEYITAGQALRYEKYGKAAVCAQALRDSAEDAMLQTGPGFAQVQERYYCASELLSLYARLLQNKHLTPVFAYGPEADVPSAITEPCSGAELAAAVEQQYDLVFGYRQLPVLYQVGKNRINPTDMFCTLRKILQNGTGADCPVTVLAGEGVLWPASYVKEEYDWSDSWIIFPEGLDGSEIVQHAKLQTWTLKPAGYDE